MSNKKNKETYGNSVTLSIPGNKKVCGYEIKKVPIGAYLSTLELIKTFPENFITSCFPGMEPDEIFDSLKNIDNKDTLNLILSGMLVEAPSMVVETISTLTGIDKEKLINDENIGLDGLVDILTTFAEVNRLGEFKEKLAKMLRKMTIAIPKTGSSESSPVA